MQGLGCLSGADLLFFYYTLKLRDWFAPKLNRIFGDQPRTPKPFGSRIPAT
jgi:hypothetical protein